MKPETYAKKKKADVFTLGSVMMDACIARGFAAADIAKMTGYTDSYFSLLKNQGRDFRLETMGKVCAAINVPPFIIVAHWENQKEKPPEERLLINDLITQYDTCRQFVHFCKEKDSVTKKIEQFAQALFPEEKLKKISPMFLKNKNKL